MKIQDLMARAHSEGWTNEDGAPLNPVFLPGLDEAAIVAIEDRLGAKLPKDYREVLRHCSGIENLYYEIDLAAAMDSWDVEEFCPKRIGLAQDIFGNFWCVDLLPTQEDEAAIFFICHDPPGVELEYIGIMPFLEEVVKASRGLPCAMLGTEVRVDLPSGREFTKVEAVGQDSVLAEFANDFPDGVTLLDLRGRCTGGIDLMEVEYVGRHVPERIFACREKKKGWFDQLLDRLFKPRKA